MIIIGLTGSIGMGKSTLSRQLALLGGKCISADVIVHQLLARGGRAVTDVGKAFPGLVKHDAVDRPALGKIVFADSLKRKALEDILHPLVVEEENEFVIRMQRLGATFVVLDIPLLFETGAQVRCDLTLVAAAPPLIQRQRVLARKGMTQELFHKITAAQMPDTQKYALADFIIPTGLGKAYSLRVLKECLRGIA